MDLLEFLDRVLPTSGRRCAGVLHQKQFKNLFQNSNEELAAAVKRIDAAGRDSYIAVGGYGAANNRTQTNVVALRSFILDIDTN